MNKRKINTFPLKIAVLGHKTIPSRQGGIEIVVEELTVRMAKLGHKITIYNRNGHHVSGKEFDEKKLKEYKGIRMKYVPTIDKKGLAAMSASFFAAVAAAFGKYDVVHFHAEGPCAMLWLPKLFVRVFSMKFHKMINVYKNVYAFITPSEFLKKKLSLNGFEEKRIHCIPTFTASKTTIGEQQIGSYGLYFGRVTEEKGVETVIKAYEKLPEYTVKIMGDDTTDEAKRLKKYVENHKMKNVEFLGFKSGAELENVIKGARFTLIPSIWYDNLPNTALESFQYSKPVIASNIGSLPELVIDGENGYLFKPSNVEDLIRKIKMLDDDTLVKKMGQASRKRLESRFAPQTHYEDLMKIFNEAVKSRK